MRLSSERATSPAVMSLVEGSRIEQCVDTGNMIVLTLGKNGKQYTLGLLVGSRPLILREGLQPINNE
jgi:hypothetical protein